jgi:deazaflavin-dependent oxidoreductase (nitroreductase family)
MSFLRVFLLILLIIVSLAATLFLVAIALGKVMHQQGVRDTLRRFIQRRVNPSTLRSAGTPSSDYAVITHVGRRSGHVYITPVSALPFGEGFVIPLPYGAHTDWCRNVLAAGTCALRWHGQEYLLEQPEVVPRAQVASVFPVFSRITAAATGIAQCLVLHPQREVPVQPEMRADDTSLTVG